MTPLQLDILNHYYCIADDYPLINENETRQNQADELSAIGLLYTPKSEEQRYLITNYGKIVFLKILKKFEKTINEEE